MSVVIPANDFSYIVYTGHWKIADLGQQGAGRLIYETTQSGASARVRFSGSSVKVFGAIPRFGAPWIPPQSSYRIESQLGSNEGVYRSTPDPGSGWEFDELLWEFKAAARMENSTLFITNIAPDGSLALDRVAITDEIDSTPEVFSVEQQSPPLVPSPSHGPSNASTSNSNSNLNGPASQSTNNHNPETSLLHDVRTETHLSTQVRTELAIGTSVTGASQGPLATTSDQAPSSSTNHGLSPSALAITISCSVLAIIFLISGLAIYLRLTRRRSRTVSQETGSPQVDPVVDPFRVHINEGPNSTPSDSPTITSKRHQIGLEGASNTSIPLLLKSRSMNLFPESLQHVESPPAYLSEYGTES